MGEQAEHGWDDLFGNDDDEVVAGESYPSWMNRDSIVFLIDAQQAMFLQNPEGEIPFCTLSYSVAVMAPVNAIKCASSTLQDKVISSDTDMIGVCFYGTREKNNTNDFDNILVFQELGTFKI